jgi:hypothetical protein
MKKSLFRNERKASNIDVSQIICFFGNFVLLSHPSIYQTPAFDDNSSNYDDGKSGIGQFNI